MKITHLIVIYIAGYGADAICPYLAFELAFALREDGLLPALADAAVYGAYQAAVETGLAKVMAKMGISMLQSYKSAQIFEAVGLAEEVVDRCFRGTPSRIGQSLRAHTRQLLDAIAFDLLAIEIQTRLDFNCQQETFYAIQFNLTTHGTARYLLFSV